MLKTLKEVKAAYPQFFENCICGAACEDGWVSILEALCNIINYEIKYSVITLNQPTGPLDHAELGKYVTFSFSQIKEKFGTLRVYFSCTFTKYADLPEDVRSSVTETLYTQAASALYNRISGAITMTEQVSCFTCEFSGDRGTLCVPADKSRSTWYKTMSPAVAKEHEYVPAVEDEDE